MTRQTTARPPGLGAAACLDRLAHARAVFVACTNRAMPSILPVRLRVEEGAILLGPVEPDVADLLDGQLVAVGAGRPARRVRHGWQVMVRGELSRAGEETGVLVLDPQALEGELLTWWTPR